MKKIIYVLLIAALSLGCSDDSESIKVEEEKMEWVVELRSVCHIYAETYTQYCITEETYNNLQDKLNDPSYHDCDTLEFKTTKGNTISGYVYKLKEGKGACWSAEDK